MIVTSINPHNGFVRAALNQNFEITFDVNIDPASLQSTMISIMYDQGQSTVPCDFSISNNVLSVFPTQSLMPSSRYMIVVSKTDFLDGITIHQTGDDENVLEDDIVVNFSTGTGIQSGSERPLSGNDINYYPMPAIESIFPQNYVMKVNTIVVTFNSEITDERSPSEVIAVECESDKGETVNLSYTPTFNGSSISIEFEDIPSSHFVYVSIPEGITLENGSAYVEGAMIFLKKPLATQVSLASLRYRFGTLNSEITDFDLYTAILDAQNTIGEVSQTTNTAEAIKNLVIYTIIERMALNKYSNGGTTVTVGNLSVAKRYPDTSLLDFLTKKAEESVEELNHISDIKVAIRGLYHHREFKRSWRRERCM